MEELSFFFFPIKSLVLIVFSLSHFLFQRRFRGGLLIVLEVVWEHLVSSWFCFLGLSAATESSRSNRQISPAKSCLPINKCRFTCLSMTQKVPEQSFGDFCQGCFLCRADFSGGASGA